MTEQAILEEKFAAEQKQADLDHHAPTAGAMTNHVLANHFMMNLKWHQISWFIKGADAENYKSVLKTVMTENNDWYNKIAEQLLDENELPASTMKEYLDYTMLEEHGENKYLNANEMLDTVVQDLATDNMFVTRAIKLAQKEERPAFQQLLVELLGWNNHQIRILQALLGKAAGEGFEEEDDEDFD